MQPELTLTRGCSADRDRPLARRWLCATVALTAAAFVIAAAFAPSVSAAPGRGLAWVLFAGSSAHVASTGWLYTLRDVRSFPMRSVGAWPGRNRRRLVVPVQEVAGRNAGGQMNSARIARTAAASSAAALVALALWAPTPGYASQARSGRHATAAATAPQASAKARTYKYSQSKVTFGSSHTDIAATDSHGDLYLFWQASGSKKWHKHLIAGATRRVSYGSPAIVWTKQALVIAVVNSKGSLETFTERARTSRWVPEVVLTGNTYQSPAMTVAANGALLVSVSDKQGGLYVLEYPTGPYGSTNEMKVAEGILGASSIVTCEEPGDVGELALITAAEAGTVYFWWQHLGDSPWDAETIASAGAPSTWSSASVVASKSNVVVTAATTIGQISAWSQPIGGTGWTESTVSPLGDGTYSRPQIAWTGAVSGGTSTAEVITAVSKSGKLSYWWTFDGQANWHAEKIAGNSCKAAYAHPAISVTGKQAIVTAVNTKSGNLEYWYQKFLTNPWHNQLVAKG